MKMHLLAPMLSFLVLNTAPAQELPLRTSLCKSMRVAGLIEQDKKLVLPTTNLSDSDFDRVTSQRVCLKSYSIGFPGGEPAFLAANSSELKADLQHLYDVVGRAQKTTITDIEKFELAKELALQKNAEFQKLNDKNRDVIRVLFIKRGHDREQMLLWGNNFYLRRLQKEGKYEEVLREIARLKKEFDLQVAPLKVWSVADKATYFSTQALKNMIAITEFKARAELSKGDRLQAKQVLEEFAQKRPAFVPLFAYLGDDPTENIRRPYCSMTSKGR